MSGEARGGVWLAAVLVATPASLWLFLANPRTPGELGSRIALGLSPDRFGAEMYAGTERLERGRRLLALEEPSERDAALARRALLEARARFESAAARGEAPKDRTRASNAWASADLELARWSLQLGKGGGLLRGDDEDLFRWGLAYAHEGLTLPGLAPSLRAELEEVTEELERELSFWR